MSNWTIFSNHGHVLVCLARDSEARLRDVAADVGLTERAVQKIVRDLQECGMISVSKHGRRNHYSIDNQQTLRHDLEAHCTLGALVDLIVNKSSSETNRGITDPEESKGDEFTPVPEATPVRVTVADKQVEPIPDDKPVADLPGKDEPKTANPSKSDDKSRTERQQGSLF